MSKPRKVLNDGWGVSSPFWKATNFEFYKYKIPSIIFWAKFDNVARVIEFMSTTEYHLLSNDSNIIKLDIYHITFQIIGYSNLNRMVFWINRTKVPVWPPPPNIWRWYILRTPLIKPSWIIFCKKVWQENIHYCKFIGFWVHCKGIFIFIRFG